MSLRHKNRSNLHSSSCEKDINQSQRQIKPEVKPDAKKVDPCCNEMLKMRKLLRFLVGKNLDNAPNMLIKPSRLGGLFWLNDFFLSNARLNKAGRASKLITLYHRQDQCDEKAKQEKPHSSLPLDIPSRISLTTAHSHMRKHETSSIRSNTTPRAIEPVPTQDGR